MYFPVGENANGPLAYLSDISNNDVRSEGMSYGMMIAVQLDKRAEFDALWNWAKTYMYQRRPGDPAYGYLLVVAQDGRHAERRMPAPDGEEYFATALYFAANRWGSGKGIYDYRAEADRLLDDMRHRKEITGPTVKGAETAAAVPPRAHDGPLHARCGEPDHTDPSYHLPAFYELWARVGAGGGPPFLAEAAMASRDFFQKATNPATGLAPNYANFDGTPVARNAKFGPDAWRTAMNWSVDWAWWAKDPRATTQRPATSVLRVQGHRHLCQPLHARRQPARQSHSTGHVAMNAVASLAATQPRSTKFVESLWNAPVPTGLSLLRRHAVPARALALRGEFRIWPP